MKIKKEKEETGIIKIQVEDKTVKNMEKMSFTKTTEINTTLIESNSINKLLTFIKSIENKELMILKKRRSIKITEKDQILYLDMTNILGIMKKKEGIFIIIDKITGITTEMIRKHIIEIKGMKVGDMMTGEMTVNVIMKGGVKLI